LRNSVGAAIPLIVLTVLLAGCRQDMQDQPKYKPLAESKFFADHRSARPMVGDTVPRGYLRTDLARYTGKTDGVDVTYFPVPITRADLERGRDRFDIYCAPCHSRLGDGNGLIVKRGYRNPPSYYTDRVMKAPVGHFFDVITNGFGAMPSYASRVTPDDRWRIIAYIRVLQFSRNAAINDVPEEDRNQLTAGATNTPVAASHPYPPPQSTMGPNEVPSPYSGVIPPAVPFNANPPAGGEVSRPYGESPASVAPGTLPVDTTVTTEGANSR
jgi:mono/diheme cytochrome c family protein